MSELGRREEIRVPGMAEPISHFTHVVKAGRLVFVSGCVATDAEGRTVGGADVLAQARRGHESLKTWLPGARAPGDAVAALGEAVRLQPGSASAQAELGGAFFEQAEYGAAAGAFREATRLRPDFARAHVGLGLALVRQGDLARAEAAFRDALR